LQVACIGLNKIKENDILILYFLKIISQDENNLSKQKVDEK
jgi:hypothetical protein